MFIHEAIAATTDSKRYITRKAWDVDGKAKHMVKILPTNTPDCCIMVSDFSRMRPARFWQPQLDDLIANDWYPCYGSLKVGEI